MGSLKYRNKHCQQDGLKFPSLGERDCYLYLKLLERVGEISSLQCQVKIPLVPGISLRVDFSYYDHLTREVVYAEYKGMETQTWKLKKKLWRTNGPGLLRVFQGRGLRMNLVEEIRPILLPSNP